MSVSSAPFWNSMPMRRRSAYSSLRAAGCSTSMPSNRTWPRVRLDLPGDQPQQRRFAGAARPHDGRDAAARNRQVQAREDRAAADRIVNVANFDDRVRARLGGSASVCSLHSTTFSDPIALSERRAAVRPLPVPSFGAVAAAARQAVELGAAEERLLARGERLRLAAPRLQRLVLQRAAVREASAPTAAGRACSSGSGARSLRPSSVRPTGTRCPARRPARSASSVRTVASATCCALARSAAFLPEMTMLGLRIMPSR